jgi:hypothetical protein
VRTFIWALGPLLAAWTLVGLVRRQRWRRAYNLPLLLLALIGSSAFAALLPHCYTWRTWLIKEALHAIALLGLGLELAVRMFRTLPGAARVSRLVTFGALLGIAALVIVAPKQQGIVADLSVTVLPLVVGGLAVLFTSLALMSAYFLIPEDPLHKAVLSSLPAYLILYCVWTAELLHESGRTVVDDVLPWVLVLVLAILGQAAWRQEEPPPAPASLVRFLWPWR